MALLLLLAVSGLSAARSFGHDFDGHPLETSSNGTVYGGVCVSVGDKDSETFTSSTVNHTSNYILPNGIDVKWARLYVDAWGGNAGSRGWINVTFNEYTCNAHYDPPWANLPIWGTWGSGNGVVWAWFNVTDNVTSGVNRVDVKSTIYNGRVYRAVLVCAYNDTDGCGHLVNYWVNDGNYNLHYDGGSGYVIDNTTTWFNGTAYNATDCNATDCNATDCPKVCCAKLTTVYHASGGGAGQASEPDYLYFNVIPTRTDHAPYYHRPNQLGDDGDTTYGDDDYADGPAPYWTMKSECVKTLLSPTNNNATFWRGHNASNGPIYHNDSYNIPDGAEGEAYLHPMLAVLVVKTTRHYAEMGLIGIHSSGKNNNYFGLPMMNDEPVPTALSAILPYLEYPAGKLYRYNSSTQQWESCIIMSGNVVGGFTTVDPVKGYCAKPSQNCTLTWTSSHGS